MCDSLKLLKTNYILKNHVTLESERLASVLISCFTEMMRLLFGPLASFGRARHHTSSSYLQLQ